MRARCVGALVLGLAAGCGAPAAAGGPFGACPVAPAEMVSTFDPGAVPESPAAFPDGVATGDVGATSAMLWTRYDGANRLTVRVLEWDGATPGPPYTRLALSRQIAPDAYGIAKLDAGCLTPGRTYDVVFLEVDGAGAFVGRSAVARFSTPPASGAGGPLTFLVSADLSQTELPFDLLAAVAAVPDTAFFLFLGDIVYADAATTRDEYRAFYEMNWGDPSFAALRAALPFYYVWDDHEVDNSWTPATIAPDRLAAARGAFLEHVPLREDASAPERLWRSYRWGDTMELFLLDCRGERRGDHIVSPEQLAWLEDGLLASTAVFKIIASSVPITAFGGPTTDERWEGFPADRSDILGFIADHAVSNVYWLSADLHASMVGDLPETGGVEIVSGPLAAGVVVNIIPDLEASPLVRYLNPVRNFHVVTLDPAADPPALTVSMRSETGVEFHRETFSE